MPIAISPKAYEPAPLFKAQRAFESVYEKTSLAGSVTALINWGKTQGIPEISEEEKKTKNPFTYGAILLQFLNDFHSKDKGKVGARFKPEELEETQRLFREIVVCFNQNDHLTLETRKTIYKHLIEQLHPQNCPEGKYASLQIIHHQLQFDASITAWLAHYRTDIVILTIGSEIDTQRRNGTLQQEGDILGEQNTNVHHIDACVRHFETNGYGVRLNRPAHEMKDTWLRPLSQTERAYAENRFDELYTPLNIVDTIVTQFTQYAYDAIKLIKEKKEYQENLHHPRPSIRAQACNALIDETKKILDIIPDVDTNCLFETSYDTPEDLETKQVTTTVTGDFVDQATFRQRIQPYVIAYFYKTGLFEGSIIDIPLPNDDILHLQKCAQDEKCSWVEKKLEKTLVPYSVKEKKETQPPLIIPESLAIDIKKMQLYYQQTYEAEQLATEFNRQHQNEANFSNLIYDIYNQLKIRLTISFADNDNFYHNMSARLVMLGVISLCIKFPLSDMLKNVFIFPLAKLAPMLAIKYPFFSFMAYLLMTITTAAMIYSSLLGIVAGLLYICIKSGTWTEQQIFTISHSLTQIGLRPRTINVITGLILLPLTIINICAIPFQIAYSFIEAGIKLLFSPINYLWDRFHLASHKEAVQLHKLAQLVNHQGDQLLQHIKLIIESLKKSTQQKMHHSKTITLSSSSLVTKAISNNKNAPVTEFKPINDKTADPTQRKITETLSQIESTHSSNPEDQAFETKKSQLCQRIRQSLYFFKPPENAQNPEPPLPAPTPSIS